MLEEESIKEPATTVPGYMVAVFRIEDRSWVRDYVRTVKEIVAAHGGTYLTRSTDAAHPEGNNPVDLVVVLKFPSVDDLHSFYNDEAYKPFREARIAGTTGNVYLVPGEPD
jgi:uncharacterized protein (DUF1330 family)